MASSFFRDLLDQIVERGRALKAFSLGSGGHDGTIEALSKGLLSGRGESSGMVVARHILAIFDVLSDDEKTEFFHFLNDVLVPDDEGLKAAAAAYLETPSNAQVMQLAKAVESPRQEFFRRLNLAPGGTVQIVRMRAELLARLKQFPELKPVDDDMAHLFGSWFNRGFLVMRRIDWSTPAAILEKIIEYEAVHEIKGWDDLKRRLNPKDRRCYGFFHPSLIDEPLIFVEVALTRDISGAIHDVISEHDETEAEDPRTAVFYSISNCQKGLAGISFGHFLIKQVVSDLSNEIESLKTFVTLSPIPGFMRWLSTMRESGEVEARELSLLEHSTWPSKKDAEKRLSDVLQPLAARYFLQEKRSDGKPIDPVARFHLGNGARLQRLNWMADLSERGLSQSAGMMVNYLYDLDYIERNHEAYAEQGVIAASSSVTKLVPAKQAGPAKERETA
ncbi:MAG: malonyl-CoA decarboxylase [Alphaproteobacteria bacterium]|nr:malonyl-CoA decarboxylase [Alphaproteobacteria bacterium]